MFPQSLYLIRKRQEGTRPEFPHVTAVLLSVLQRLLKASEELLSTATLFLLLGVFHKNMPAKSDIQTVQKSVCQFSLVNESVFAINEYRSTWLLALTVDPLLTDFIPYYCQQSVSQHLDEFDYHYFNLTDLSPQTRGDMKIYKERKIKWERQTEKKRRTEGQREQRKWDKERK